MRALVVIESRVVWGGSLLQCVVRKEAVLLMQLQRFNVRFLASLRYSPSV